MLFTTSWDDGYATDERLAQLLEEHGCTGTFYICPRPQHTQTMLSTEAIRRIAKRHELGAHSMTHPRLTQIPDDRARMEITQSKEWIEKQSGARCQIFCYPYGDANANIRSLVQDAGFRGARIVEQLKFSADDPYQLPTTLQLSPFPFRKRFSRLWHILDPLGPARVKQRRLREMRVPLRQQRSWLSLARHLLKYAVETKQPFFHLWGHSHEVDRYQLWKDLDAFLTTVADYGTQIEHGPNSALINTISNERMATSD